MSAPRSDARRVRCVRLSAAELAELERVRRARGDRTLTDTIRALPAIWDALRGWEAVAPAVRRD